MKFKTFRMIVVLVIATLLCGLCGGLASVLGLVGGDDAPKPAPPSLNPPPARVDPPPPTRDTRPVPPPPTRDAPPAKVVLPPAVGHGVRPKDKAILAQAKAGIRGTKLKDAFPHKPWKASFYCDRGDGTVNRIKVDLDRDDSWDEKWTIDGNEVKRQVSPIDDDATYSQEFMLQGMRWEPSAVQPTVAEVKAPPARPTPSTPARPANPRNPAVTGAPLRSLDRRLLERAKRGIPGSKLKDAYKGERWKANIYAEGGRVTRLKLDLDRDGKWDEKWTFDSVSDVKRQVAPADDERYSQEFRLRGGRWVSK